MHGPRFALIGTILYMLVVAAALMVPAGRPGAVSIFVPIGWGLHRSVRRRGAAPRTRLLVVAILAAAYSLTMETLQAWLPNRYSSVVDVLANTLGATIGAWIESRYGHRV